MYQVSFCNLHICLLPVRAVNESRHHCEKNGQAEKTKKKKALVLEITLAACSKFSPRFPLCPNFWEELFFQHFCSGYNLRLDT